MRPVFEVCDPISELPVKSKTLTGGNFHAAECNCDNLPSLFNYNNYQDSGNIQAVLWPKCSWHVTWACAKILSAHFNTKKRAGPMWIAIWRAGTALAVTIRYTSLFKTLTKGKIYTTAENITNNLPSLFNCNDDWTLDNHQNSRPCY